MKKIAIGKTKTIRQKVYEHVRASILDGELQPGDRLVEAEIGRSIGTSRTPVREALHALERENLVSVIPRIGYVVNEMSEKELDDLSEIRLVLETLALRWAMQADARSLARSLRLNIEQAEELIEKGELKSFVDLDLRFHETISKFADSERLQELTLNIRQYMLRYQKRSLYENINISRALAAHREILRAVENDDRDGAQAALSDHIKQARKDIAHYGNLAARKKDMK
jgi:DNA-binding GntR family transcriptional regulator